MAYDSDVTAAHIDAAAASGVGGAPQAGGSAASDSQGDGFSRQGDDSPEIQQVKERLVELGYRPGSADGNFGAHTTSAVLAFQNEKVSNAMASSDLR